MTRRATDLFGGVPSGLTTPTAVPRTELLGQLVAALVVGKRAQFAVGIPT